MKIQNEYPVFSGRALRNLIQFPSTNVCEQKISHMVHLKVKYRNRLILEHNIRCSLSLMEPQFAELTKKKYTPSSFTLRLDSFTI